MPKGFKQAGPKHIREILKLLDESLVKADGPDNIWKYKAGISDHTIAEIVGLSHTSVAHVRMECYGRLFRQHASKGAVSSAALDDLIDAITSLAHTTELMQSQLDELTRRHDTLCKDLASHGVLDCRHLVMPKNDAHVGTA